MSKIIIIFREVNREVYIYRGPSKGVETLDIENQTSIDPSIAASNLTQ